MMTITEQNGATLDSIWQERLTEQFLQFARAHVWGWLVRWNRVNSCPLPEADLEDILSEILLTVLHFKLPEGASAWEPCLMAYLKRVARRIYNRFRSQRRIVLSLDALPPELLPTVSIEDTCSQDEGAFVQAVAQQLLKMPRHHALAFLLQLDSELAECLLQAGGAALERHLACDALYELVQGAPLPDREIARHLQLTPRAVIRARQHARERLRNCLQAIGA